MTILNPARQAQSTLLQGLGTALLSMLPNKYQTAKIAYKYAKRGMSKAMVPYGKKRKRSSSKAMGAKSSAKGYSKKRTRRPRSKKPRTSAKSLIRNVVNHMHSTHVFTRQTQIIANAAINTKAFLVLDPCNGVTQLENYIAALVGTDGYVEQQSRCVLDSTETHLEFYTDSNPGYIRFYYLRARQSKTGTNSGGVPAGASSIGTLLTNDDSEYKQAISLATSLQNTLFDSPSVTREYQILKCTKWRKLTPLENQPIRLKMRATYPKVLDSGSDKISTLWRYVKGSVIIVAEFKGFMGHDVATVVPPTYIESVPNTNNALTAYTVPVTEQTIGNFSTDSTNSHMNSSAITIRVRRYDRGCLRLESDEVREIANVLDVTPSGTRPVYVSRTIDNYQASSS